MNKKIQITVLVFLVVLVGLACNMERVVNPSLPTNTPSPTSPAIVPQIQLTTPTITPTPQPGTRIESGDQALFYGDWDSAIHEYTTAIKNNDDNETQIAAYLGLGRTYFATQQYQKALDALNTANGLLPNNVEKSEILFASAQVYETLGQTSEAINAYQEYINLRPGLLEVYVYDWIGDLYMELADYQSAIDYYTLAFQSPHIGDTLDINIKIGDANESMGETESAIVIYQDVLDRTNNDYTKAQMLRKIGTAYIKIGLKDQGHEAYLRTVKDYPLSYNSYLALVALVDAGIPVNDFERGLVDYYAGQYSAASSSFERYIASKPEEYVDTAYYYNGLTLMAVGAYEDAIAEFQKIIDRYPGTEHWADAYDEISYIQWTYLDDYEGAVETIEKMLELAPENPQAPELLYFAARIAERDNKLKKAANLWEHLGIAYSNSEYAFDGFFQAGIIHYRLGEYAEGINQFQSALGLALTKEEQAQALFWVGKAYQALGDQQSAFTGFQQALEADPTGYYSERSRDILEFRNAFDPPENYSLEIDENAERQQAETWLRLVFSISEDVDLNDLTPLLLDPRFNRGTELWNLGLYNQARTEFESLRTDITSDPLNSYRLGKYLIDLGLYRSGIMAIREVLTLAGYDDAGRLRAPVYFNHLRFGLYFPEIVVPAAEKYNLHPLLLFSVIRQESLFEGFVTSTAGARGLMQIVPSTGETIFNRSGWPLGYTDQDLYRPLVNITYGADYLASQRNAFNDIYTALAAYNGGPGNASAWASIADGDQDLFVEVTRFEETRRYLRNIYEQYVIYRDLYSTDQ